MLERGLPNLSQKDVLTANANACQFSFGIEALNKFCSGIVYRALASQKTGPYRGGIVGLVGAPMRHFSERAPPASLTLARLGFLMHFLSTVWSRSLGIYRLIEDLKEASRL